MPKLNELPGAGGRKIQQYAERGSAELHYAPQDLRGGRVQDGAAAERRRDGRRHPKWGEIRHDPVAQRPPHSRPRGDHRRRRRGDASRNSTTPPTRSPTACWQWASGRRRRRDPGPQPPLVPDRALRRAPRSGARLILLNSEFSGPQIKEVSEREGAKLIIYDDEYTKAVSAADPPLGKLRALRDQPRQRRAVREHRRDARRPDRPQQERARRRRRRSTRKIIILTSGTTGTPKGANRSSPPSLAPIGGMLSHVPFKSGEVTSLPAPMFHALGFLHATIAMMLGSTLVLRRKFKPAHGARRHREAQGDRRGRGAGHAVANPGRARKDGPEAEPVEPEDRLRLRLAAGRRTGRPGRSRISGPSSTTSTAPPRSRSPPSPGPRTCRSTRPPSGRWSRA